MSDEELMVMRGNKNANIIWDISEMYNISIEEATDIYYKSDTASFIEEGVSDLQCRSDKYLATLVWEEYMESNRHPIAR